MRVSRDERLREMFMSRPFEWIPLNEILDLRISQYGRAIHTFRHKFGMKIENKTLYCKEDGLIHSWFRYLPHEKQQEMFA